MQMRLANQPAAGNPVHAPGNPAVPEPKREEAAPDVGSQEWREQYRREAAMREAVETTAREGAGGASAGGAPVVGSLEWREEYKREADAFYIPNPPTPTPVFLYSNRKHYWSRVRWYTQNNHLFQLCCPRGRPRHEKQRLGQQMRLRLGRPVRSPWRSCDRGIDMIVA